MDLWTERGPRHWQTGYTSDARPRITLLAGAFGVLDFKHKVHFRRIEKTPLGKLLTSSEETLFTFLQSEHLISVLSEVFSDDSFSRNWGRNAMHDCS